MLDLYLTGCGILFYIMSVLSRKDKDWTDLMSVQLLCCQFILNIYLSAKSRQDPLIVEMAQQIPLVVVHPDGSLSVVQTPAVGSLTICSLCTLSPDALKGKVLCRSRGV